MLLKTFKRNYLSESKYEVVVHNLSVDMFETFIVDYCKIENNNLDKMIELYDKKATLNDCHFNKAIGLISVWCSIK